MWLRVAIRSRADGGPTVALDLTSDGRNLCVWAGLGNVRGPTTWYLYCDEGVVGHELGHNIGLGHAGTDPEDDGQVNVACKLFCCCVPVWSPRPPFRTRPLCCPLAYVGILRSRSTGMPTALLMGQIGREARWGIR